MAKIIIHLGDDSSIADVEQLIKEVKRKKYVVDAWLVRESDYASQHSVQRTGLQIPDHEHNFKNSFYCSVCGEALF